LLLLIGDAVLFPWLRRRWLFVGVIRRRGAEGWTNYPAAVNLWLLLIFTQVTRTERVHF
jgi:hypothetical protein